MDIKKILTGVTILIALIGVIGYAYLIGGEGDLPVDGIQTHDFKVSGFLIKFSMILTGIALVVALVAGLVQLVLNFNQKKNIVIGAVIFAVFLFIMWLVFGKSMPEGVTSPATERDVLSANWATASWGIMSAVWLTIITFVLALVWGFINAIKK